MKDETEIWFDSKGKGHVFDDEYSVTIHHDTEEEMNRTMEFLKHRAFWIPVTERLPRESEYVLATVKEDNFHSYVACAHMSGGKWRVDGTNYLADVIAWARLPEPYHEEDKHHDD